MRIGRRAGTTAAMWCYKKNYPKLKLTEPTVRRLKNQYKDEVKKRPLEERDSVEELPMKKRGRPLMIGEELDGQVKRYLGELRKRGAVVNVSIAIAVGKGIVKSSDSSYKEVKPTRDWAKYLLRNMGFVKRKASTSEKLSVEDFEAKRELFLHEVQVVVEMEKIPAELIINLKLNIFQLHLGP